MLRTFSALMMRRDAGNNRLKVALFWRMSAGPRNRHRPAARAHPTDLDLDFLAELEGIYDIEQGRFTDIAS